MINLFLYELNLILINNEPIKLKNKKILSLFDEIFHCILLFWLYFQ